MAYDDDRFYDYFDRPPDGYVLCPRCDGHQTVNCHCGGDLCVCENYGEKPCPFCGGEYDGEGYVTKERADIYIAKQAEYVKAFRDGWAKAEAEAAAKKQR